MFHLVALHKTMI